jgi:hypothetical protein
VNSPAATVEGAASLVGVDVDLSALKVDVAPNEQSGALIGEGIGPGPEALVAGAAKGLKALDKLTKVVPTLPPAPKLVDPELDKIVSEALAEANSATVTLYHGGVLRGGEVGPGKFSTTPSFAHAEQFAAMRGGDVHRFDVPRRFLRESEMTGGMRELTDVLQGTSQSAPEMRFLGDTSPMLNQFRVKF